MEYDTQAKGDNKNNGGAGEGDEVNIMAATGVVTRTAERRQKRVQTIQGASAKIRHVEAARHGGTREGMEAGGSDCGEETE